MGGDKDGSQSGLYSDPSGRLGSKQSGSRPGSNLSSRPGSSMKKFDARGSARNRKKTFGTEVLVLMLASFQYRSCLHNDNHYSVA